MNVEVLADFGMNTVERLSKIYGEVFPRLVSKAAVSFVSKKLGETAPNIESLEEAGSYVKSKLEKYPMGHCAFWYGIAKAETQFQGSAGPAFRLMLRNVVKEICDQTGVAEMIGPTDSTADAMLNMSKVFIDVGMLDEGVLSFRNGSKHSYELITTNCVNGDGCKAMIADGIIQSGTKKPICASALGSSVAAELVTKVPHEYEIITLSPPNCVAKVMRLE